MSFDLSIEYLVKHLNYAVEQNKVSKGKEIPTAGQITECSFEYSNNSSFTLLVFYNTYTEPCEVILSVQLASIDHPKNLITDYTPFGLLPCQSLLSTTHSFYWHSELLKERENSRSIDLFIQS